jgi:hypothetical protein
MFKIIKVMSDSTTGIVRVRATFRGFAGLPFSKTYLPTMTNRPDGTRSALRQLVESVYGKMTDNEAYDLDLELLVGHEVPAEIVAGKVGI